MTVGKLWSKAFVVGVAGVLIASGATADATAVGKSSAAVGQTASTAKYAYLAHGPYSTQASCEASRYPSDPPDYYTFACSYSSNGTYYPPHYTQPGWYWVTEYNTQ